MWNKLKARHLVFIIGFFISSITSIWSKGTAQDMLMLLILIGIGILIKEGELWLNII